jgi:hypothetical protein
MTPIDFEVIWSGVKAHIEHGKIPSFLILCFADIKFGTLVHRKEQVDLRLRNQDQAGNTKILSVLYFKSTCTLS